MTPATTYSNLTIDQMVDMAVQRGEGVIATNGALRVLTGPRTGRSPKDKFIVRDHTTERGVNWGDINQPIAPEAFEQLWQDASASLKQHNIYETKMQVGSHPDHSVTVTVRCNFVWHTLFCDVLFINPETPLKETEWTLINAAYFTPIGAKYGLPGSAAVVLDFTKKRILICGTHYAGEMKKAMFSVLNYLLPEKDVLPMHCAANKGADGTTALFFGLSGTGKTTLSADPERLLIGDDEHGWAPDGIFNFEGGCYAKCIRLSQKYEPLIWNAMKHGAVMENVVLDDNNAPLYDDESITENTRAAYPLEFIAERAMGNVHPHPNSVIFLTCDLYGVLPAVSKLTHDQVVYYFLSGYTALVGSTEVGHGKSIRPTFSQCFGAPFFARHPRVYADMLVKRLRETKAEVFLVNTGWSGGAYGAGGERFSIDVTRQVVKAVTSGEMHKAEYELIQPLGLHIPKKLHDLGPEILNPKLSWKDPQQYEAYAQRLIKEFEENYSAKGFADFERKALGAQ